MIFDKLCGIAERHLQLLDIILRQTRIFHLKGASHEILKNYIYAKTDDELNEIFDTFFMPYNNIAIEDDASCIILLDTKRDQIGLGGPRLFVEALPHTLHSKGFATGGEFKKAFKNEVIESEQKGEMSIIFGVCNCKAIEKDNMLMEGKVDLFYVGSKDGVENYTEKIKQESYEYQKYLNENSIQNVIAAYNEIIYFNQPDRFVLQQTPAKKSGKKSGKKSKIPRTHERPVYTLLKPDEIRAKMGLSNPHTGTGKSKRPHERRKHWRYLSDEMYSRDEHGNPIEPKVIPSGPRRGELYYKKIIVPDSWVGPSRNQVGNKIYKVMLNV